MCGDDDGEDCGGRREAAGRVVVVVGGRGRHAKLAGFYPVVIYKIELHNVLNNKTEFTHF